MIVVFTLIAVVQGACSKWRRDGAGQNDAEPWCGPSECDDVADGEEQGILGGLVRVRNFGSPCVMTVAWPFWQRTVYGFQARVIAQNGDVFPSRYGVFELLSCDNTDPRGRPGKELPIGQYAIVFYGKHDLPKDIAISPDDVFIPLKGEAALDGGWVVTAELVDNGADGRTATAAITVVHRSEPMSDVVYPALRVGDSFPWSDRVATLVRIVEPQPPHVVGWIEVNLAAPPGDAK